MTVYFEEEGAYQLPFDCRKLAEKVIAEAVDYEQCPYETEVNLLLTMNEEIREMNREFREIDRATDVLSFPMVDYGTPGDFEFLEEDDSYFHRGNIFYLSVSSRQAFFFTKFIIILF